MPTKSKKTESQTVFVRTNYVIILLACVTIIVGLALMAGSGSTEEAFQADIFSVRRVVIAPIVCLMGYLTIIVGILWNFKRKRDHNSS